jgi:hypothetical protein
MEAAVRPHRHRPQAAPKCRSSRGALPDWRHYPRFKRRRVRIDYPGHLSPAPLVRVPRSVGRAEQWPFAHSLPVGRLYKAVEPVGYAKIPRGLDPAISATRSWVSVVKSEASWLFGNPILSLGLAAVRATPARRLLTSAEYCCWARLKTGGFARLTCLKTPGYTAYAASDGSEAVTLVCCRM